MWHWWDALCGVGAAGLSPQRPPPQHGGCMDRVLCHPVTLWGGDMTGSPRTGIRGRPAASQPVGFGPTAGPNSQSPWV